MLVMARERRAPLMGVLESCEIEVLAFGSCREAQRMLKTQPPVHVVVTDTALPDGDWRTVLEIVAQGCENTEVVVALRLGDPKLWLDILEQGGFDVVVEPYQLVDVRRIVEAAAAKSLHANAQATSHRHKAARGWTG